VLAFLINTPTCLDFFDFPITCRFIIVFSKGTKGATFKGTTLEGATVEYTTLEGATFKGTTLVTVGFKGTTVEGTTLVMVGFKGTTVEGTKVEGTTVEDIVTG
jgi:uncharacterized protein YjbI with pentapeptide repeats